MNSDQRFRDLGDEDRKWLSDQRRTIEKLLAGNPDAQLKYQTSAGKLGTIRAVLEGCTFRSDQTFELQGLGIILGDALSAEMGLVWKMLEDQYGISPCLVAEGTSVVLYPQTMISKRIERGEAVDVFDLFNSVCDQIEDLKARGAEMTPNSSFQRTCRSNGGCIAWCTTSRSSGATDTQIR